jgi:hypothetical protein
LKTVTEFSRIHAMLLVENKFLSLYSRWRNVSEYVCLHELILPFYIFSSLYHFLQVIFSEVHIRYLGALLWFIFCKSVNNFSLFWLTCTYRTYILLADGRNSFLVTALIK